MPYLILVCLARSSAEFTGEDILEAVRKAGVVGVGEGEVLGVGEVVGVGGGGSG